MGSKTHKKRCWVTIILAIIGSVLTIAGTVYCILAVDRESAAILPIVGITATFFPCLLCYLIEYRIRFKKEIAVKNRARAIKAAEEAKRKEEEDRRIAEANAELWSERWESYIKPLLKFILIAVAILIAIFVIVGGIESFISSFGIIAFLLVIIIIILLVKR
jgi:small-conductance mechanosensitive channel